MGMRKDGYRFPVEVRTRMLPPYKGQMVRVSIVSGKPHGTSELNKSAARRAALPPDRRTNSPDDLRPRYCYEQHNGPRAVQQVFGYSLEEFQRIDLKA